MAEQGNDCDKKAPMKTLLSGPEKWFILWLVPKFPRWVTSQHLTLMTVAWSVGVVGFGWLAGATGNLHWLWASSLMIFMQWFTDSFDGAIGRYPQRHRPFESIYAGVENAINPSFSLLKSRNQ